MSFEDRIAPPSAPVHTAEHEARYRFAAPAIRAAGTWCDLSQSAASVDLTSVPELDALCRQLEEGPMPLVVTCFGTIEHLNTFVPLVNALLELGRRGGTVFLSVPNDVFGEVTDSHHETTWGAGGLAELRQMLPADHVVAHQVPLEGSAIVQPGQRFTPPDIVAHDRQVPPPLAFLLAWGPGVADLGPCSVASPSDTLGRRVSEAQREVDVRHLRKAALEVGRLSLRVAELEAELNLFADHAL